MMRIDKKYLTRVVYGNTPEERFKEIHGMTIEEWYEAKFNAKTGMSRDEWYINRMKSTTPCDFIKERYSTVTEDDIKLINDLQVLGLKDEVINVLLDYALMISNIGMVHPLVREMGEYCYKENILTIENAITLSEK